MPAKKKAPEPTLNDEQRQAAIEKALLTGKPAKTAQKVHNVSDWNDKVSESSQIHPLNVKSVEKVSEKASRGRPSSFTQEIADEICARIGEGEPLEVICRNDHMPARRTVHDWMKAREDFSAAIARARVEGFDAIAAECLEIADETAFDTIQTENGDRANSEWIQRSKLRIETRLKLLAKWDPKRYGDKVDVNHGVQPDNPLAALMAQIQNTPMRPKDKE